MHDTRTEHSLTPAAVALETTPQDSRGFGFPEATAERYGARLDSTVSSVISTIRASTVTSVW